MITDSKNHSISSKPGESGILQALPQSSFICLFKQQLLSMYSRSSAVSGIPKDETTKTVHILKDSTE